MKRLPLIIGLALIAIGGGLVGYALFSGGGDGGDGGTPPSFAYTNDVQCEACPINVTTAEVQDRDGSTLFVFGGDWPAGPADIPSDLRLEANDVELVLHPAAEGFQVLTAAAGGEEMDPAQFAVGLRDGVLLLDVRDPLLAAPVEFAFGLWDGTTYTARIPSEGTLQWDGTGAPARAVAPPASPTPTVTETTVTPELESAQTFAADLAEAINTGDGDFLFARLGQATIDRYGEQACRTYTAGINDPTRDFTVTSVSEPAPWDYVTDGLTTTVPDTLTVAVTGTADGQPLDGELHFQRVGSLLAWFTDCGDPATV